MKASVTLDIAPFPTPALAFVRLGSVTQETSPIPLHALDSETLEKLCAEFTKEVFKKAGKERLPTVGSGT
jgi:hypothetical protein